MLRSRDPGPPLLLLYYKAAMPLPLAPTAVPLELPLELPLVPLRVPLALALILPLGLGLLLALLLPRAWWSCGCCSRELGRMVSRRRVGVVHNWAFHCIAPPT